MSTLRDVSPPFTYRRRPTRRVAVGDVGVGGDEPIRVQSMTTPRTSDTEATAQQVLALAEAGCEIVRVSVPSIPEAHSLPALRTRLEQLGVRVPLVADIHFNPRAAMLAADTCEKVRVNPGNYADTKRFMVREYSDDEYVAELDRIRERFAPLVEKCRRLGRSMRIGTNHGSLSDRIMNRYGDTPLGMVESALEFLRICGELDYHDVILSMKSSNPFVAVQAYRLLAERMAAEGMDHPFHLGVTEAGDGDDARIKSAIGIGSLLADGLGDTIRVSLTENPVAEVPVARALAERWNDLATAGPRNERPAATSVEDRSDPGADALASIPDPRQLEGPARRRVEQLRIDAATIHHDAPVQVWLDLGPALPAEAVVTRARAALAAARAAGTPPDVAHLSVALPADLDGVRAIGRALPTTPLAVTVDGALAADEASWNEVLAACSLPILRPAAATRGGWRAALESAATAARAAGRELGVSLDPAGLPVPDGARVPETAPGAGDEPAPAPPGAEDAGIAGAARGHDANPHRASVTEAIAGGEMAARMAAAAVEAVETVRAATGRLPLVAIEPPPRTSPLGLARAAVARLDERGLAAPILLVDSSSVAGDPDALLEGACRLGGLLVDGIGDAVRVDGAADERALARAFGVLQATRLRMSRPDYISCPSCGRTLFDLEETTARVKRVTSHLRGVKIAVMGCIVNGPGEMADADFGYVGSSPGKVNLYVRKDCIVKNVPAAEAPERLVELIKEHGRWIEPAEATG